MIAGVVDRPVTEVDPVSGGPKLLIVLSIFVARIVPSLRETWIVDDSTACGVSVLRNAQEKDELIVKLGTTLLVLP